MGKQTLTAQGGVPRKNTIVKLNAASTLFQWGVWGRELVRIAWMEISPLLKDSMHILISVAVDRCSRLMAWLGESMAATEAAIGGAGVDFFALDVG